MFAHEEGTVFILQNGDLIKVNPCRVMPYEKKKASEETVEVDKEEERSGDSEEQEEEEKDAIANKTRSHMILSMDESLDEDEEIM